MPPYAPPANPLIGSVSPTTAGADAEGQLYPAAYGSSGPPPLLPQSHPSILFKSGVCRFAKKIGAGTVIADVKEHSLAARGRRVNDVDRELVSGTASSEASKAAGEVAADSAGG